MRSVSYNNATEQRHAGRSASFSRFDCVCRFLYIVGVQSVRILHRWRRRSVTYLRPVGFLMRHLYAVTLGRQFHRIRKEFTAISQSTSHAGRRIRHARQKGFFCAVHEFFRSAGRNLTFHKSFVFRLLNVAVPAACVLILVSVVSYWNGLHFGLLLFNQGKQIAAISDEKVYEQATEMVSQRMVHDTVQQESGIKFTPGFRLTAEDRQYQTPGSVCDLLIKQSNGIIEDASGLYVDGELIGAVKSSADLRYMLQNLLDAAKGKDQNAAAGFVRNVETVSGLYPTTSIITTDAMRQYINGTSKAGTTYTVRQGDTATSIAAANHTTVAELQKINHNLGDAIKPGDLIQLQVAVPTLAVELVKTVTYEEKMPYSTVTQKDDSQYTDYSRVLKQGSDGRQRCVDTVYTVNGIETKRTNVSQTVMVQPVSKIVVVGTKKRPVNEKGVASGTFMWPVPSLHDITTYFTWRWGVFHKGIDISGSGAYGCTIVAADGGIVSLSGWNDGYGKCIIIDHENGKKTLYGHCSSLLVSEGEAVSKGEPIARVGSTGDSTGSHCHFEVIVGGSNVNPLNYVS